MVDIVNLGVHTQDGGVVPNVQQASEDVADIFGMYSSDRYMTLAVTEHMDKRRLATGYNVHFRDSEGLFSENPNSTFLIGVCISEILRITRGKYARFNQ